ncbi:hypothetical protein A4U94_03865 [Prescottella equi]|nr:hypothetical protein A4U94_03865 [Prescottella equi]OQQ31710.1 hypothetical protein A6411_07560 [Prescottella equi]
MCRLASRSAAVEDVEQQPQHLDLLTQFADTVSGDRIQERTRRPVYSRCTSTQPAPSTRRFGAPNEQSERHMTYDPAV